MQRLRQRHPRRALSFILGLLIILPLPTSAQKQNPPAAQPKAAEAPPKDAPPPPVVEDIEEEISFDALLAADSYSVYAEARLIGRQMSAGQALGQIVRAAEQLRLAPGELRTLTGFLTTHAEQLAESRLMVALLPASPQAGLPQALVAVDFTSVAEARRFESSARRFVDTLKTLVALRDKSAAEPPPANAPKRRGRAVLSATPPPAAAPPLHLTRKANVLLLSDSAVDLRALKPAKSEALFENPHFQTLRSRFASEQFFVYVATGPMQRNHRRQVERLTQMQRELEQKNGGAAMPPVVAPEPSATVAEPETVIAEAEGVAPPAEIEQPAPPEEAAPEDQSAAPGPVVEVAPVAGGDENAMSPSEAAMLANPLGMLPLFLFGGSLDASHSNWPEALGVGLQAEGDELAVRALLTHGAEGAVTPIPMLNFLTFGPALPMTAPEHAPEDTELFVGASLDVPFVLEFFLSLRATVTDAGPPGNSPGAMETKYGLKKDDLYAAFGNEIAVGIPMDDFLRTAGSAPPADDAQRGPVFYLAVRDKNRLQEVLPRVLEAIGAKNAQEQMLPETSDDVQISGYQQSATALMGDFLVLGTNAQDVRRVIAAHQQRRTLAGKKDFLDAMNWAPPQKLGYAYLAETFTRKILRGTQRAVERADETTKRFYADLPQEARPLSYALSDAGAGILHELRLPKSLVLTAMAWTAAEANKLPLAKNEDAALAELNWIYSAQQQYRAGEGQGNYGTLEQLVKANLLPPTSSRGGRNGYRFEVNVSGAHFQATAIPEVYGKTGQRSYFIDETGIARGGDTGGGPASAAEAPVF